MGVDINEAGGHELVARIDDAAGACTTRQQVCADGDDPITDDGDVGDAAFCTGAVDERAASDHEVVGAHRSLLSTVESKQ